MLVWHKRLCYTFYMSKPTHTAATCPTCGTSVA
jgi:hypothetical protein